MAKNNLFLLVILSVLTSCAIEKEKTNELKFETAEQLLQAMKTENDGSWFEHFTFKQHTVFFDTTGQRTDSAMWYEAVSYPYLFRIDRDIEKGNYTIYRNDSTYHILADTMYSATDNPAVHLVIKGGLYFISLDETIEKLEKYGFNLQAFRKEAFMGEPAYVIGDDGNQFWIHAENYYCMRRISTNSQGKITDVVYEDFKPLGDGWVEQKVTFYYDGKKRMEEFYQDIKERDTITPATYSVIENYKWYEENWFSK